MLRRRAGTIAGMRQLNLDQLHTLVTIADLGTLAAAAQALHLAPPTVSLHVSELEARLGVSLLVRGPRRAQLTAAGQALVRRGRRLLADADAAVEQVRRIAQGREGKVRLGTSTGVVVHLLPQVLESLAQHRPGLDVELSILGSHDTLARLAAEKLELGIVALPVQPPPGVVLTPWRSDPMHAFVPAQWDDVPEVATPAWLAAQPLIANDAQALMHHQTARWFAQAGFHPRARIELNFTEAMKSLVAAGYGAAVLPLESPLQTTPDPRIRLLPLDPPLTRHLALAHPAPDSLDGPTREVLTALHTFAQPLNRVD